jgi:hypothetical protein
MVVAVASAVLTMACQGCVAVSPHDQMRIEPAVPPTVGMMMAAPGPQSAVSPIAADRAVISVHVVDGLPSRFTGTPLGLGSELATLAFPARRQISLQALWWPHRPASLNWAGPARGL